MSAFDFADAERGLAGTIRGPATALLFDHEDVLAASPSAEVELGEGNGDGSGSARARLDGVSLEVELAPLGQRVGLRTDALGAEELQVCRVLGELGRGGDRDELACLGIRYSGTPAPDFSRLALVRSIAIAFGDGGLLALRAARPREAQGHGDEEVSAVVCDPEAGIAEIDEVLLSTQYDEAGRQVRANLEMWEAGDGPGAPLRAAGAIVCGTSLALGEQRLNLAFFRWSMGGRPGLGRYEVLAGPDA